jgi:hypothetical protein
MSNIKNDPEYDPFPKTGLTKKYEPFIRKWVTAFCKRYPRVRRQDALAEAVKIAVELEPKFDTSRAKDFSTAMRHHLKGLKRILVDSEQNHSKHLIHAKDGEVPEEIAKRRMLDDWASAQFDRRAGEEAQPTEVLSFGSGGNGARITIQTKGVTVGIQLPGSTDPLEVIERLSPDLRIVISYNMPAIKGQIRAVVADSERRQREADQEAENQRLGIGIRYFLR